MAGEDIVKKKREKLLVTSNFSFSHNVFYPMWYLFFILSHFKMSAIVSIWTSLIFCRLVMGLAPFFIQHVSFTLEKNEENQSGAVTECYLPPPAF